MVSVFYDTVREVKAYAQVIYLCQFPIEYNSYESQIRISISPLQKDIKYLIKDMGYDYSNAEDRVNVRNEFNELDIISFLDSSSCERWHQYKQRKNTSGSCTITLSKIDGWEVYLKNKLDELGINLPTHIAVPPNVIEVIKEDALKSARSLTYFKSLLSNNGVELDEKSAWCQWHCIRGCYNQPEYTNINHPRYSPRFISFGKTTFGFHMSGLYKRHRPKMSLAHLKQFYKREKHKGIGPIGMQAGADVNDYLISLAKRVHRSCKSKKQWLEFCKENNLPSILPKVKILCWEIDHFPDENDLFLAGIEDTNHPDFLLWVTKSFHRRLTKIRFKGLEAKPAFMLNKEHITVDEIKKLCKMLRGREKGKSYVSPKLRNTFEKVIADYELQILYKTPDITI